MKKARNEGFNKLRYFCFIGIIAFGLITSIGPASSEGAEGVESAQLGELRYFTLDSKEVGVSYRIGIVTPPGYNESGAPYPAVFTLDGAYYLQTFREGFYGNDSDIIIVAILNSYRRNIDYMPLNECNSGGGGNYAFLNFLVLFHSKSNLIGFSKPFGRIPPITRRNAVRMPRWSAFWGAWRPSRARRSPGSRRWAPTWSSRRV